MIRFNPHTLDAEMPIGDTGTFSIKPKINDEPLLKDGDHVWFTLRKLKDNTILIQKEVTTFYDGVATIPIEPSDTANMNAGNYIYDIVLIRSDGTTDTLIPNRPFAYFQLKKGVK